MRPIVPGHFSGSQYGNEESFYNVRLRVGEVQAIYYPEDPQNVSKRFVEYQVWVQHRTNGTAVTKLYDHCIAIDHFGSLADFSFATYRADPSATRKDSAKVLKPGLGAKVAILCINGETTQGLILGAIRNSLADKDAKTDGHHLHSRFNGVDVEINSDGEFTLTYSGSTKVDGTLNDDVDTGSVGTFVQFSKDGNVLVSDKDGKNTILLDHAGDKIAIESDNEMDITADTVKVSGQSEVDIGAPTVDIEGEEQVTVKAPQVAIGEGELEPPLKALTFNTALETFLAAMGAYVTAMAAVDPTGGIATATMEAAIATFATAAPTAAATTVTVG